VRKIRRCPYPHQLDAKEHTVHNCNLRTAIVPEGEFLTDAATYATQLPVLSHFYPNPTIVRRTVGPVRCCRANTRSSVRFLEDGCDAVQLFAVRASRDYAKQRVTDQGKSRPRESRFSRSRIASRRDRQLFVVRIPKHKTSKLLVGFDRDTFRAK